MDITIKHQKDKIEELDRKVNPHHYCLSSGAELIGHRFMGNNPCIITLKIWTRVGEVEYSPVAYISDNDRRLAAFSAGELTKYEFINEVFCSAEQVNEAQAVLLNAAMNLAMGGPAQAHVGTGGGESTSDLPWRDKKKDGEVRKKR